jgi:hypothetical protein
MIIPDILSLSKKKHLKKYLFVCLTFIACLQGVAKTIRFEVQFSKPLAVFVFIQNINLMGRPNFDVYRTTFLKSEYNTPYYQSLLLSFKSITFNYSFNYNDIPYKSGFEAVSILKRNLVTTSSLAEFKFRTIGLLPIAQVNQLIEILIAFTPVYEKLIYEAAKPKFDKQVIEIRNALEKKNIPVYFEEARKFYRSSWDTTIPLKIILYPLPLSQGFGATAYSDVAECAIPDSLREFSGVLSVLLHEASHLLYEEQPAATHFQLKEWIKKQPSRYNRFAELLVNESWATAIANGYFTEKLRDSLNPGSWYYQKYINLMAKAIFPQLKQYLQTGKAVDEVFVSHYVRIFHDSAGRWMYELPFLMTYRSVLSDNRSHFDTLDLLYRYGTEVNYYTGFTKESFSQLKDRPVKFVIVSNDNATKLDYIKKEFAGLENWRPDADTDFTMSKLLNDKSVIIIFNLVTRSLVQQTKERVKDL